jgi:trk system potassium uptake protein TrkA
MEIIIAGAGQVGFRLAKTLSLKHNVTIVDKNSLALDRLQETIDILPVVGDIEDPDTFGSLKEKEFDLFIAVTNDDEANILSTLIADDIIKVKKKIIRLRNPYFVKSSIAQKLRIDDAVFPYISSANSIGSLLDFPKANNVKNFIFTDFKLLSVKVSDSFLSGRELKKVKKDNLIVVGIEREKDFFIPSDEDILKEGDLIYFFGEQIALKEISFKLNTLPPSAIKKVAIFGADLLGIEIAKVFIKKRAEIKLIDKNPSLCQKAADILQNKVMVINSKYIGHSLYEDENLKNADMIVTTSNEDEENIIKSLEAKEFGVKKVVAINNNLEYYDLMHRLKITPVRGPKSSAYYQILEKIGSSAIITEKHYCGGRGAVFVRKIFENSSLIGKKIRPLKVSGCLNFLVRNGKIESFIAPIFAKKGDVLILFLKNRLEERAKEWIYSL